MPLKLHQDEAPSINLTSMIDILFLLIIFFMVGTNFGMPEGHLTLDLPKVSSNVAPTAKPDRVVVEVKANGEVFFDMQPMQLGQLTNRMRQMKQQRPGLAVVIRSDGNAPTMTTVSVLDAVRQAGIGNVNIAANPSTIR